MRGAGRECKRRGVGSRFLRGLLARGGTYRQGQARVGSSDQEFSTCGEFSTCNILLEQAAFLNVIVVS